MSRHSKYGLDCFPLDVKLDDKFKFIEAEFGLKGFAVVVKLFQKIYSEQGYYCEFTRDVGLLFSSEIKEGYNLVSEIVCASVKRGIFNEALFEKYSILTSRGIQRRYFANFDENANFKVKSQYLLVECAQNQKTVQNIEDLTKSGGEKIKEKRKGAKEKRNNNNFINIKGLPSEISREWSAFCDMRVKIKKPLTEYAAELIFKKLSKLSGGDISIMQSILNQSVENCWRGVFPLKNQSCDLSGSSSDLNSYSAAAILQGKDVVI